ncbi:MAG: hypothetical protein O2U61_06260 [Candidatus Bathyarchaeota archaeon]|nr:hypothetical protein [Candidatus Bathyarchaeota archaeon]
MSKRSAEYTLLGFYYQFDKSIFEILNQSEEDNVLTIEGIEDIDISSATEETVMQIKYQEQSKGNDSILRKPIKLMLKHFSGKESLGLKYVLYGHYTNNTDVKTSFDLARLKSMLTYTEDGISIEFLKDNNISDDTVERFIKKFELILGPSFKDHQESTFKKIKSEFGLSKQEEIEIYYSNALKIIYDLSVKKTISTRKITKKDFKKKIDLKSILFNHWFIKLKSKEKYLKYIHSKYFKNSLNTLNIVRIFILNVSSDNLEDLKNVIYEIEDRFYIKSRKSITSGAPYIYIHNLSQKDLTTLKETIYNDDKAFIDGFCFHGSNFKCNELKKESTVENKISIKFINKKEYLDEILSNVIGTKKLFEFCDEKHNFICNDSDFTVKIQIEELKDIPMIIKGK